MAGSKTGSRSRHHPPEVKARVLELRRQGKFWDEIEDETGVPKTTGQGWAREAGIRVPYRRRTSTSRAGMKMPKKNAHYTIRKSSAAKPPREQESHRNRPFALDIERNVRERLANRRD